MVRRLREQLAEIRHDFTAPLEGGVGLSRGARFRLRMRRLAAKYGWRLVLAAVAFYLVRDLLLYVLLPYLAIRSFAW
jgi:hypothetical protein